MTNCADWACRYQQPTEDDIDALIAAHNIEGVVIQPYAVGGELTIATRRSIDHCLSRGLSVDCYLPPNWTSASLTLWLHIYNLTTRAYGQDIARWWLDVEDDTINDPAPISPAEIIDAGLRLLPDNTGVYYALGTVDQYLPNWTWSLSIPRWVARWGTEPSLRQWESMAQYKAGVVITPNFTVDLNVY